MQVTETQADGLKREFKVQISAEEFDEKLSGRLQEIGNQVKVPGFRPGKVPLKVLRQRFGKAVQGEVLENAVNDSSNQAINERGLRPAVQPKIEITSFDEGKDLEYTMAFEVLPDIEPMDFSGLALERKVIRVEDSEVERVLGELAEAHKTTRPLNAPRPAQTGDVLVVDFKGTVEGEAYPGMSAEDHHLELGTNAFVAGFEDQLIGAQVGETRTVELTFPETYVNDKLAGKPAAFEVTIENILEPVPAAIDDRLAQNLGEPDLGALKERVRERLAADYRDLSRSFLKRQLLDKLAEAHDFPVPEGMVEAEFQSIWRQIEADRERGELDPEDANKSEDELCEEYRTIAARRVRLGLLLSEVGRRNGIEVTDEEVGMALQREMRRYPGQEQQVMEFYRNTPQAMANLRAPIFEDKVIDFIVDLAEVTEQEVTPEALKAELDAEKSKEAKPAAPEASAPESTAGTSTTAGSTTGAAS